MSLPLPPLEPFTGNWESYIDHIYAIYKQTILQSNLRYNNLPVQPRFTPESHGKHHGFWHITSDGEIEEEREPDLRRCERIRWVQWVIDNVAAYAEVSWWEEKRGNTLEIVIWIESEQYVVVLSERRDYWLLKTAYLATKSGKIKQLTRNREKFLNSIKS